MTRANSNGISNLKQSTETVDILNILLNPHFRTSEKKDRTKSQSKLYFCCIYLKCILDSSKLILDCHQCERNIARMRQHATSRE